MTTMPLKIQSLYDYIMQTPGALQNYPSALKLLAAWGFMKQSSLQLFIDCLTNRLAGYHSDPGALEYEFGLPSDARLLANKMTWCQMRGCRGAIFGMLNAMGHPNVSIYTIGGRSDSPYATAIPSGAMSSLNAAVFMQTRYASVIASAPTLLVARELQYHMFTVAVWDCQTNSSCPIPVFNNVHFGYYLGHAGPNNGVSSAFYTGETSQQVLADVVRFGCGAESIPMEIFLCYPNAGTGQGSIFDLNGDPGTVGGTYADYIETVSMDYLKF